MNLTPAKTVSTHTRGGGGVHRGKPESSDEGRVRAGAARIAYRKWLAS